MSLFRGRTRAVFAGFATLALCGAAGWAGAFAEQAPKPVPAKTVDYNRDIRPLLSGKCLACHGADPKAVQAGLRLDTWAGATTKRASGEQAIVPGNPQKSELVSRIWAKDAATQMPPPASHKSLTKAEKNLLTRWITEGAEYKPHWAFVKPMRPALPAVHAKSWPINGIDTFVLARLEKEGLRPSPPASKQTLLRRVTLDLTGLPPTPQEMSAFLADKSPNAYEKAVDGLLASPRYGEKMAQAWMDGARYADSNGYQADYERYQYRWRDWVINAYNQNMPFDRFTVEQIAGDLLPHATLDQKLATGFNRNHRINTEGGVIAEEWRAETVIDRVETTSAVWMGLTVGCARCHDHKYDPVSQRDFYRFYSFFNNVPETGSGVERPVNHPPFIKSPTPAQAATLAALSAEVDAARRAATQKEAAFPQAKAEAFCRTAAQNWDAQLSPDLETHLTFAQAPAQAAAGAQITGRPTFGAPGNVSGAAQFDGASFVDYAGAAGDFDTAKTDKNGFSYGAWINPQSPNGVPLSRMDDANAYRGWDIFLANRAGFRPPDFPLARRRHEGNHEPSRANGEMDARFRHVRRVGQSLGVRIYLNGKPAMLKTEMDTWHGGSLKTTRLLRVGGRSTGQAFKGSVDEVRLYRRVLSPVDVALLADTDPLRPPSSCLPKNERPHQNAALRHFALQETDADYKQLARREASATTARDAYDATVPTTMVMDEMPTPRPAFVFVRGQYDKPGEAVTAGLPVSLGSLPARRAQQPAGACPMDSKRR